MEKTFRYNQLFSIRESVLLATTIYLLHDDHSLVTDWCSFLAVLFFLISALTWIIKEDCRFKWDKGILGFAICWATLTIGLQWLSIRTSGIDQLYQLLPVWENITLVFIFATMLIMFVLAFTYLILHKLGKWTFHVSIDKAVMTCMGDYLTITMLLLACARAL